MHCWVIWILIYDKQRRTAPLAREPFAVLKV